MLTPALCHPCANFFVPGSLCLPFSSTTPPQAESQRAHLQEHTVSRADAKMLAHDKDIFPHEAQAKTLVLV